MLKKAGALALIVMVAAGAARTSDLFHFGLAKSMPAADASVASVEAVELWFTQVPQDESVTVRLIDAGGDLVETGGPERDADDGKHITVSVTNALSAGSYTVAWRGIGDDGHVVRNEFGFTVSAN